MHAPISNYLKIEEIKQIKPSKTTKVLKKLLALSQKFYSLEGITMWRLTWFDKVSHEVITGSFQTVSYLISSLNNPNIRLYNGTVEYSPTTFNPIL